MRLFGWFRKPKLKEKIIAAKQAVWQVDVYTKDGVYPEKFYDNHYYSNCLINDGCLIIQNIDNETVVYNMDIVERYIAVEIEPGITEELISV